MYKPLAETISASSVFGRFSARALRRVRMMTFAFCFMAVASALTSGPSSGRAATPNRHDDRVVSLILHLADQAQRSSDLGFAVRVQAQAGLLLWPYDHDQARAIFRRAFQSLLRSPVDFQPTSALEAARRQQLRVEFLNQIAGCDPEMAESLARSFALPPAAIIKPVSFAPSEGVSSGIAIQGRLEAESRELLVSVAMRLAEVHKRRAAALAQLSLETGVSPYFDRLLLRLGKSRQALADRLFCNAVDYLERSQRVSLDDIHTLSVYLISARHAADSDHLPQAAIIRFLNLACDVVVCDGPVGEEEAARPDATDQASQLASTARYLSELLRRYLPAEAARLQARLAELADRQTGGPAREVHPTPPVHPFALEQAAHASADARKRDELYAKAAFGWLARAELREAQRAAMNIADPQSRDRLMLAVARRLLSKAYVKEALLVAPLVQDRVGKADLLVKLSQAVLAAGNSRCAQTLLDLAELEAEKIESPFVRAQSLLAIVAGFSASYPARAFTVMREAVDALNDVPAREPQALDAEQAGTRPLDAQAEDLFQLSFVNSLTALARLDFDRALLLAQQLNGKEVSLIAQLAVCQGGYDQKSHSRSERDER